MEEWVRQLLEQLMTYMRILHKEGEWHWNKLVHRITQLPPDLVNFNTPHQLNVYAIEQESILRLPQRKGSNLVKERPMNYDESGTPNTEKS